MPIYRGSWLLLTPFYVTVYVTRTDSEISVEGTIIILTSKPSLHYKESPYLIFLKVVGIYLQSGTRVFAVVWRGGRTSEIRGITHRLPRTRSTPKPHVCRVYGGVVAVFDVCFVRNGRLGGGFAF